MGSLLLSRCFMSSSEALDAYYSGAIPADTTSGSTTYITEYSKELGVWYVKSYTKTTTGAPVLKSSKAAPIPQFPECDPSETFMDGLLVGWGVATAMIAVSVFLMMRRAAR